ncbi:hypothetical protein EV184_103360 [Sinorhizobium americanum]|uniref:Uncharacterized protein n=1 Tax=Sinorhizobium americanum TaxID=194963 RepID=A0A4R2BZR2_9HYPH|nr:hypothetical protein EV184_103360 [Sinorhizobium americanum]
MVPRTAGSFCVASNRTAAKFTEVYQYRQHSLADKSVAIEKVQSERLLEDL